MSSTAELVGGGLAVAGCVVAVLATVAMYLVPAHEDRLHLLAPVTTIAAPIVGAGLIVANGVSLTSGQIALIVVLLAMTGPSITVAIARAHRQRKGAPSEGPE